MSKYICMCNHTSRKISTYAYSDQLMKERGEFHGATKITLSNKSKKEIIIRVNTAPDSWKYVMIVVNMLGGVAHAWAIFFSSGLDFVFYQRQ